MRTPLPPSTGARSCATSNGKIRRPSISGVRSSIGMRIANLLRSLGVRKGDRVAGILPRVPETVAVMIGTWKIGGVYVPIFTGFGSDAICFRLHSSEAKVAFTHHEYRNRLARPSEVAVVTIGGPSARGGGQGEL